MARVRKRIGDRKVLALLKAFLAAGVMTELGTTARSDMGTPQGGIISPLLANIALSVLDEHFERAWRDQSRYNGRPSLRASHGTTNVPAYPVCRRLRADGEGDAGTGRGGQRGGCDGAREGAEADPPAREELVTHIDDGFDFLGFRIQRETRNGKRTVCTFPSRKAFESVKRRVKALTRHTTTSLPLSQLLYRLNPLLRGWASYFRFAASKRTFAYLDYFTWWRWVRWLRKKPKRPSWKRLRRRWLRNWEIGEHGVTLFRASRVPVERYRYRGSRIPSRWERVSP